MYYIHAQEWANARGFEHEYRRPSRAAVVTACARAESPRVPGCGRVTGSSAVDGQPAGLATASLLDAFGRTPPGRSLASQVAAAGGARTIISRSPVTSDRRTGHRLVGKPLVAGARDGAHRISADFPRGGVGVLLQRPGDRDAWVMAIAFGGLIASAPLLPIEPQMPSPLRRFMVPVWVFLVSTMPAALYDFFAVFPAASALDRRVPWLKRAARRRRRGRRHGHGRASASRSATAKGSGGCRARVDRHGRRGSCGPTASRACCSRSRR